MSSHPSDTCHHCRSIAHVSPHRHTLACLIRLAARRLSTPPHLSLRGQDCRQITSLAFHLCHAGMLTLWQLAAVFSQRKKKKAQGLHRAGWEPNNGWQCARHQAVILMAAVGMYGAEVTHKRGCLCLLAHGCKATDMQIKSRCFQRTKTWRSHILQNSFCQRCPTITCLRLANEQAEFVLYFFYSLRLSEMVC